LRAGRLTQTNSGHGGQQLRTRWSSIPHRPRSCSRPMSGCGKCVTALLGRSPRFFLRIDRAVDLQRLSAPEPVSRDLCAVHISRSYCAAPRSGAHGSVEAHRNRPSRPAAQPLICFAQAKSRVTGSARKQWLSCEELCVVRCPQPHRTALPSRACFSRGFSTKVLRRTGADLDSKPSDWMAKSHWRTRAQRSRRNARGSCSLESMTDLFFARAEPCEKRRSFSPLAAPGMTV